MDDNYPAITHNRSTPLSMAGNTLNLTWEEPGRNVGPDNKYNTSTNATEARVRLSPSLHFSCPFNLYFLA